MTPQQLNGFDCGVFACQILEAASRGRGGGPGKWDFSQTDMPYLRKRMMLEIGRSVLLPLLSPPFPPSFYFSLSLLLLWTYGEGDRGLIPVLPSSASFSFQVQTALRSTLIRSTRPSLPASLITLAHRRLPPDRPSISPPRHRPASSDLPTPSPSVVASFLSPFPPSLAFPLEDFPRPPPVPSRSRRSIQVTSHSHLADSARKKKEEWMDIEREAGDVRDRN